MFLNQPLNINESPMTRLLLRNNLDLKRQGSASGWYNFSFPPSKAGPHGKKLNLKGGV